MCQRNLSLNQISFGRFITKPRRKCDMDLFIMQADGKKIVDPNKQSSLLSRLRTELYRPLRVAVVSRGPDTELLVANPVELSGEGRPLVFYDITLALKMLEICIFSVITDLLSKIVKVKSFSPLNLHLCSHYVNIPMNCFNRLKLGDTWSETASGKFIESCSTKGRDCLFQETWLRREFGRCWWVGSDQCMVVVMTFSTLWMNLCLCTYNNDIIKFIRSNCEI